jgi:hypothetical protein
VRLASIEAERCSTSLTVRVSRWGLLCEYLAFREGPRTHRTTWVDRVTPRRARVSRGPLHIPLLHNLYLICRNKAVSNGAVSFYLDNAVTSRVSRATYGVEVYYDYDSTDPEHRKRGRLVEVHCATGEPILRGGFSVILPKVCHISKSLDYMRSFGGAFLEYSNPSEPRVPLFLQSPIY